MAAPTGATWNQISSFLRDLGALRAAACLGQLRGPQPPAGAPAAYVIVFEGGQPKTVPAVEPAPEAPAIETTVVEEEAPPQIEAGGEGGDGGSGEK